MSAINQTFLSVETLLSQYQMKDDPSTQAKMFDTQQLNLQLKNAINTQNNPNGTQEVSALLDRFPHAVEIWFPRRSQTLFDWGKKGIDSMTMETIAEKAKCILSLRIEASTVLDEVSYPNLTGISVEELLKEHPEIQQLQLEGCHVYSSMFNHTPNLTSLHLKCPVSSDRLSALVRKISTLSQLRILVLQGESFAEMSRADKDLIRRGCPHLTHFEVQQKAKSALKCAIA